MRFYFEYLPQDVLNILFSKITYIPYIICSEVLDNTDINYEQVFLMTYPSLYKPMRDIIEECFTIYADKVDVTYYGYVNRKCSQISHESFEPKKVITLNIDKWLCVLEEIFPIRRDWVGGAKRTQAYVLNKLLFYIKYPELYLLINKDKYYRFRHFEEVDEVTFENTKVKVDVIGVGIRSSQILTYFDEPLTYNLLEICQEFMGLDDWKEIVTYITTNFDFGVMSHHATINTTLLYFIVINRLPANGWGLLYDAYQSGDVYLVKKIIDQTERFSPYKFEHSTVLENYIQIFGDKRHPEIDQILRDRLGLNI